MAEQAAIEAKIAAVNRAEVEREEEEERMREEERMKEEEMEMMEAAEKMVAEEVAREVKGANYQFNQMLPSFLAKMRQVESISQGQGIGQQDKLGSCEAEFILNQICAQGSW